MEFKIEVAEDGYILTKNQYLSSEEKKVYFSVKSLVEDLENILVKLNNEKNGEN